jgi:hypothetical protein
MLSTEPSQEIGETTPSGRGFLRNASARWTTRKLALCARPTSRSGTITVAAASCPGRPPPLTFDTDPQAFTAEPDSHSGKEPRADFVVEGPRQSCRVVPMPEARACRSIGLKERTVAAVLSAIELTKRFSDITAVNELPERIFVGRPPNRSPWTPSSVRRRSAARTSVDLRRESSLGVGQVT